MKYLLLLLFLVHAHCTSTNLLCHKWSCMSEKLKIPDSPTKEQYANFLRSNLPVDWQDVVDTVVDACYEKRHKTYLDTCPGQGLFTCIVDHLNKNCPVGSWRKEDGCTTLQLSTSRNWNSMFYRGRYLDFEKNLPIDKRPEFFMRNYFKEKCCDLPALHNSSLVECGFKRLVDYHIFPVLKKYIPEKPIDPLDCCDMENFIQKEWRTDCDFKLKWDDRRRLVIDTTNEPVTTTTEEPKLLKYTDVKIVPNSCEQETCIFSKLNIISNGVVDKEAFSKLLDNMTNVHTEWKKTKAKVVRLCLNKPLGYEDSCEINNILACTFDVLTENCPDENKNDPCRHSTSAIDGIICQISSSKYRPRSRRQLCKFPNFVSYEVLSECGVSSVYKVENVPQPAARSTAWKSYDNCRETPESAKCVLRKMDVFNRYGFIDRFNMSRKIGLYAAEFPPLFERMYKNVLDNIPLYTNHCMTSRKLLNLIDSMVTTCPYEKFKKSDKCTNLMKQIRRTSDLDTFKQESTTENIKTTHRTVSKSSYHSNPLFNFGILGAGDIPPVKIIDLKSTTQKTLVLLPVYSRMSKDPLAINSIHNDGIFRSNDKPIPY